jgi:hypothetical protein
MVARTGETSKVSDIKYYGYAVYTVTFTTNDTFTAPDFISTENLKKAEINKNSDGSDCTCTILNNVVTFTQAAITDQECTVYVFGVRS